MGFSKETLVRKSVLILFWIWALFGFVSEEFLTFLEGMRTPLYFGFDIILAVIGVVCLRNRKDIVFFVTFLLIGYVSTMLVNSLALTNFANGLRDFFGLLFVPPILRYLFEDERRRERTRRVFDKHLFIFLIIQAPCLLYQFLKYGANDHGGGSLGNFNSGVISTLIYMISFYLVLPRWNRDNYFQSAKNNIVYLLLLIPSFLNETKVSFVYFALYFFLLMKFDKKLIMRMAIAVPFFAIGVYIVYNAYESATQNDKVDITDLSYYIDEYLFSDDTDHLIELAEMLDEGEFQDDDDWSIDVPRFSRLFLMPAITATSAGGILWGAGLSQFKGKSLLNQTKFARDYEWYVNGTVLYIQIIFTQLGLVGLIWAIFYFVSLFRFKIDGYTKNKYLLWLLGLTYALTFVYQQSFRFPLFCLIMIYLTFRGCSFEKVSSDSLSEPDDQPTPDATDINAKESVEVEANLTKN